MGFFFLSLFPILTISWDVNSHQKGNDRINDGYQKVAKLFFQSKTVIGSLGCTKKGCRLPLGRRNRLPKLCFMEG